MLFVSAIGITGQVLLKRGLQSFSHLGFDSFFTKIFTIVLQPVILLALLCYAIGILAYLFLLSKVELSSVYPICTSLTLGGITFFGWFLLHESMSWPKILGIIFVIIGIFLIERFS
jgi:multidrug transporter EmrE-like cation transporter